MSKSTPWAMPPLETPQGLQDDPRTGDPQYLHLILMPGQRTWIRANWAQVLSARAIEPRIPVRLEQPVREDPSWEFKGRPTLAFVEAALGTGGRSAEVWGAVVHGVVQGDDVRIVDPKGLGPVTEILDMRTTGLGNYEGSDA